MKNLSKALTIMMIAIMIVALFLTFISCEKEVQYESISVMSFNIRIKTSIDGGEKNWSVRRPLLKSYITSKNVDIICMQEVTKEQYTDVSKDYGDTYIVYWSGRDDSENPEGLAVLYKKDKFTEVKRDSFWLSETPDEMSLGWNARYYRICVSMLLNIKGSEHAPIGIYNVHLDHMSVNAQTNGIRLVCERAKASGSQAIVCGDFNANENDKPSNAFSVACEYFSDCRLTATESSECVSTYNAFGDPLSLFFMQELYASPIDHCLVDSRIKADKFEILEETPNESGYYSDHYAIKATLRVEK